MEVKSIRWDVCKDICGLTSLVLLQKGSAMGM